MILQAIDHCISPSLYVSISRWMDRSIFLSIDWNFAGDEIEREDLQLQSQSFGRWSAEAVVVYEITDT